MQKTRRKTHDSQTSDLGTARKGAQFKPQFQGHERVIKVGSNKQQVPKTKTVCVKTLEGSTGFKIVPQHSKKTTPNPQGYAKEERRNT